MPRTRLTPTTLTGMTVEPLDIALLEPFAIATGGVTAAHNALVRVMLADGTEGMGEAAPFPPSGGETQETALAALQGMRSVVEGCDVVRWRSVAERLEASFEHQTTARAALEVAMLDALTRSWGIPLYVYLGGAQSRVETDITIPIAEAAHMAALATRYASRGARTLKLKVGMAVDDDLDRVQAVAQAAPDCDLILDGNQGYTAHEALELVRGLAEEGIAPVLFEQPTHRHDLDGMRYVAQRAGVPVAADESAQSAADVVRIAQMGAAQVVNIKLMKAGVAEALRIVEVCKAAHLGLMVGAMMESRLSIAAAAHVVAGVGGFRFVDLDTPMLLRDDPFVGGYEQEGMVYALDRVRMGHGVRRL